MLTKFSFLKAVVLLVAICFFQLAARAQSFTDATFLEGINHTYNGQYGGGLSFYDYNHDGWDDITLCENGSFISIYTNIEGSFANEGPTIPNIQEAKMVLWVDYDNDGDSDMSITSLLGAFRLFQNDGDFNFTDVTVEKGLPINELPSYGHSWGDIDNDGLLDLYICNYDANTHTNYLFKGTENGPFEDLSLGNVANDGLKYSFLASFIDYNYDGWQDIFVINDRVSSANTLYRNQGNGTFSEVSGIVGVDQSIFSMSNTYADYNLDGLFDLYVSNNPTGNLLLTAQPDFTFIETADEAGCAIYDMSWCATFLDFDNDRDEDLFICNTPFWAQPGQNNFLTNDGSGAFTSANDLGFTGYTGWQHNAVRGDFNHDGHPDLCVIGQAPQNTRLFKAATTDNNWIKIGTEGVESNRDAIGTRIDVWSEGLNQMRYRQCGEGYLAQHSQYEMIGLGEAEVVDSIIVTWLSGWIDQLYNVDVNQTLNITEGSTHTLDLNVSGNGPACPGSTVVVSHNNEGDFISWGNGTTADSINIHEPGYVTVLYNGPFATLTDSVYVDFYEWTEISAEITEPFCFGDANGSVLLTTPGGETLEVLWNGEAGGPQLEDVSSGFQDYLIVDGLTCVQSGSIFIDQPDNIALTVEWTNPSCFGFEDGTVSGTATGGTGDVFVTFPTCGNPDAVIAGIYPVIALDEIGCAAETIIEVTDPEELLVNFTVNQPQSEVISGNIQIIPSGGTPPWNNEWSNGDLDVWENYDLQLGSYAVDITDANGCLLTIDFVIDDVFSVHELEESYLVIYPNPTDHRITVESLEGKGIYYIHDLTGKIVMQGIITSTTTNIDLSSLATGAYQLLVKESGPYQRASLFKQ